MYDSDLITYAVSIHFSQDICDSIAAAVTAIACGCENRFRLEKNIPPHITIGAFHGMKENEQRLFQIVAEVVQAQETFCVHFTEIGSFKDKVLFLKPENHAELVKLNKELHTRILPEFESAQNGFYLPENFFPHTTLATGLSKSQFSKALNIARQISLPMEASVSEVSVYQCSPFAKLKTFSLQR